MIALCQIQRLSTCFFISSGRNGAVYVYVWRRVASVLH